MVAQGLALGLGPWSAPLMRPRFQCALYMGVPGPVYSTFLIVNLMSFEVLLHYIDTLFQAQLEIPL